MKLTRMETFMVNLPSQRLYGLCAKRDAKPPTIADMSVDERREYDRIKRAESRAAHRKAKEEGALPPTLQAKWPTRRSCWSPPVVRVRSRS